MLSIQEIQSCFNIQVTYTERIKSVFFKAVEMSQISRDSLVPSFKFTAFSFSFHLAE